MNAGGGSKLPFSRTRVVLLGDGGQRTSGP
jgi:hypothetical protein